jgi:glycosyltransferase involved in cell wall biosynthesis
MGEPPGILLVANFADRRGGGEESLLTLARGLDRRRYAPCALVPGEGEIAAALRGLDIPVALLPMPQVRPWTLPAVLGGLRRLRALLATWRPRLIHAHGSRGALYAGLVARASRIPVIWHVRIADRDPVLDRGLVGLAARVIVISRAVAARFDGCRHAGKIRVVYNGVDPEDWAPGVAVAPASGRVVLLAGRLCRDKGQRTLVRASRAVLAEVPDARFVLLGADTDGEAERLRGLSRQLGVDHAVELRPWIADPRPAFRASDVITLPSRSEGFGRVLVEAACLGKPVVASRVGGIPEVVVDRHTGLLVPAEDPRALASALITLLRDADLRRTLGSAARERALTRFTAQAHVGGVQAVYDEVCGERHG